MKRIITGILLLLAFVATMRSQNGGTYMEIIQAELRLRSLFEQLYNEEVTGKNMPVYHLIDSLFQEALMLPGSFDHHWEKLDMIGRLVSDDGQVKVFSWMYMASREEYHYTAYIQMKDRKGEVELFRLEPATGAERYSENFSQDLSNWHGKVYYALLTNEYKRKTFYTLLGADFKNTFSTMKTIEVFAIQRGKPVFRGKQFLAGGTVKDRVVLEYSAELSASLRYNRELDMIVFDHLAPLHPIYFGNYQFYGPDGSYDGYRFTEGIWVFEQDVDARNNR